MSTVEAYIKIRGDTSRFQSAFTDASKVTDKFFDSFKKRMDKLDRLKINSKIGIIDNATDALKKIEKLSDRVKSSVSSIPRVVNLSSVEQGIFKQGNHEKRIKEPNKNVLSNDSSAGLVTPSIEKQEVPKIGENIVKEPQKSSGVINSLSPVIPATLAVLGTGATFIAAQRLTERSTRARDALGRVTSTVKENRMEIAKGAVEILTAEDKPRAAAELAGDKLGEKAGGVIGAAIGTAIMPGIGTAAGGALGSLVGSFAGKWVAGKLVDNFSAKDDQNIEQAGKEVLEQQNRRVANTSQAVSDQQERIASTGQAYLDNQKNLSQSFTSLNQAVDNTSAKLNDFSGSQILPQKPQSNESAVDSRDAFLKEKCYGKYATGGILSRPHLGLVAEAGPEAIIPLSARVRSRALALWRQAGEYLGVKPYATGSLVGMMPTPVVAGGGGVNLTVPVNVNLQVSSDSIDYETIKDEVGWRIAKSVKKALENKVG